MPEVDDLDLGTHQWLPPHPHDLDGIDLVRQINVWIEQHIAEALSVAVGDLDHMEITDGLLVRPKQGALVLARMTASNPASEQRCLSRRVRTRSPAKWPPYRAGDCD